MPKTHSQIVMRAWFVGAVSFALTWWAPSAATAADKATSKPAATSKVVEKPADSDDDHDSEAVIPDDVSHDIDEDLTALVVPVERLGKVEKSKRLQFSQALRGLLQEGVSVDGAAAAKRHYEMAHLAVAGDPRAAYAYGLALLEQKNTKEALAKFQASAKQTTGTYLPALQAAGWVLLARHEYAPALTALTDLARRIEETKESWPTERDRNHAAEWLGRTLGFLSGPGAPADNAAQVGETAASIEKLLTGERRLAFEHGRKGISWRHKELEAQAARPVDEVVREMNAKRQSARIDVQAAQEEIKRIEAEIRDAKQPFDKQIAEANVEIRTNAQKARTAAKDIPEVEDEVAYLSIAQQKPNGYNSYRGRPTSMRFRNENAAEKKARETQLASAKQRLQQLQTSVTNAKQGMVDARKERDKAQAELRSAVAAKQPELREARRKSQESTVHLRDAEHAVLSPEQIKSRVAALEAYVPLDPYVEKDRLLATLKMPGE